MGGGLATRIVLPKASSRDDSVLHAQPHLPFDPPPRLPAKNFDCSKETGDGLLATATVVWGRESPFRRACRDPGSGRSLPGQEISGGGGTRDNMGTAESVMPRSARARHICNSYNDSKS